MAQQSPNHQIAKSPDSLPLGLYLHVPFCRSICNYCNFNRGLLDDTRSAYVAALAQEIAREGDGEPADTIFFGGGTPSLLAPDEIGALIDACRRGFDVSRDVEITLEANPDDVTTERLVGYRAAGVNRLSFGVQSFRDNELAMLDRRHSAAQAREAVRAARTAGFDNVSLDLMLWLPGQTVRDSRESIDELIALQPDHASLYLLELYPNSPLREDMAREQWSLAPDDDAADMYLEGLDRLERAGYRQYEISNVARDGRVSRHNIKYWTDGEWLGFGCGAHSTRGSTRWQRVAGTGEYIARIGQGRETGIERRVLSADDRIEEALFTGLRLTEGIDLAAFERRYGVNVWRRYGGELQRHVDAGLVFHGRERLQLTRRGMLLANEVMAVFV